MRNLSRQEQKLIIIQFFNFLSYSLTGVFVNVFFFAHGDLKTTILYNIISSTSFAVFYGMSGWTLRKVSSGLMMKISFLTSAVFYFLLFFLKEQSVTYIVPLGIISGFSAGNYWPAYNLNQYILTRAGRREEYFGWALALVNLANAIGPITAGTLISYIAYLSSSLSTGYAVLFFLVFTIMIAAVVVIGKLPSHEPPQFSYRHLFSHRRSLAWKLVLGQQGLMGFYDVALATVSGVLLYLLLGGEAPLGFALTIAATLATGASIISIRILKRYKSGFWIGVIGSMVSIFSLGFFQNMVGAWVFILVSGATMAFFQNGLTIEVFRVLDNTEGGWRQKYHLLLEQSLVIQLFRIVSFLLLFFILELADEVSVARTWLMILPILPLFIGYFLRRSHLLH